MIRRRKLKCLLLLGLPLFLLISVVFYDAATTPKKAKVVYPVGPRTGSSPFITIFPTAKKNSTTTVGVKTILFWTGFFGSQDWLTHKETFQPCAVKSCRVTTGRGEVGEADAVLMNVRDIYSPSDLPPVHPPHQVWIIHGSEPPYYIYLNLERFNNVFNWTSWYRTDADIFSPYGHFTPVGPVRDLKSDAANPDQHPDQGGAPPGDVFQPNFFDQDLLLRSFSVNRDQQLHHADEDAVAEEDPFALHDRLVFWAASSCLNYAQRYKLVSALQEFLPVDSYGACGNMTCLRNSRDCEALLKRYKFVLAFENGYCRDYLTEKYWNAISRNQIPIVSGGADYSKIAVPGSYIDVDHFTSVESLALYVLRVASDRRLYNSFFAWKSRYRILGYGVCNWCQLCSALHDESKPPQVYSDFRGWLGEDTCPLQNSFHYIVWLLRYTRFNLFGI